MNTTKRTFAVLATTAVLATGAGLTASALTQDTPPPAPRTTATSTTLPDGVAKQLQHTREEERMARDLYAALASAHDNDRPMSMITRAEDQHFNAVGTLLNRYGLTDPSAGRQAGSYAYPDLQKLYDDWYAKGKVSPNAAHEVGVELEKWDVAGLQKDVAATTQNDVKTLYTHLLEASQHHLTAYEAAASGQTPAPGTGNGPGAGNGPGTGRGMGQHMGQHLGNGPHHGNGTGQPGDCPMVDGDE